MGTRSAYIPWVHHLALELPDHESLIEAKARLEGAAWTEHACRVAAGFCFLAAILDACSRKVVGYAISRRIDTQLALAALNAAVQTRRPAKGCIHHSDRGCQVRKRCLSKGVEGIRP